jgi:hypothetical protein
MLRREPREWIPAQARLEMDANDAGVARVGAGSDARASRLAQPLVEEGPDGQALGRQRNPTRFGAERGLKLVPNLGARPALMLMGDRNRRYSSNVAIRRLEK